MNHVSLDQPGTLTLSQFEKIVRDVKSLPEWRPSTLQEVIENVRQLQDVLFHVQLLQEVPGTNTTPKSEPEEPVRTETSIS